MAREVFDPKNPEYEFYNAERPKRSSGYIQKPRRKNILRSKIFIIGYGIFLVTTLSAITIYQKQIPVFKNNKTISRLLKINTLSVKINNTEVFTDKIKATIEIENKIYRANDNTINTLQAYTTLLSNKTVIASNYSAYDNVRFREKERIGYSSTFSKYAWDKSDTMNIKLVLDDNDVFEKKINTRLIKIKK